MNTPLFGLSWCPTEDRIELDHDTFSRARIEHVSQVSSLLPDDVANDLASDVNGDRFAVVGVVRLADQPRGPAVTDSL
jgi:hypothetical protein